MTRRGRRLPTAVDRARSERGEQIFNQRLFCLSCGIGYEPLDPRLFSFNSQQGACGDCGGMGFTWDFDAALIFADPRQTLREAISGISPGSSVNGSETERALQRLLMGLQDKRGVDIDKPFAKLARKTQEEILHGSAGRGGFVGLVPFLKELAEASAVHCRGHGDEAQIGPKRRGGIERFETELVDARADLFEHHGGVGKAIAGGAP